MLIHPNSLDNLRSVRARSGQGNALLVGMIALFGIVAGLIFFLVSGEDQNAPRGVVSVGDIQQPINVPVAPEDVREIGREEVAAGAGNSASTVLWPLRIELDLEQAGYLPQTIDVEPMGSGGHARMAGTIAGKAGRPLQAEVRFVEGANRGRVLYCDSEGSFGANDLYPGIAIVEVKAVGSFGSRREVILRQNQETLLNLGYGRLGAMHGQVLDYAGAPIEGAKVRVDGRLGYSDEEGWFFIDQLAGDYALLEIEKEGYCALRGTVGITAGHTIERGRLSYRLGSTATLDITLSGVVGAKEPAQVIILPADVKEIRKFPWYTVSPLAVYPGTTAHVEGLPEGLLAVRVFHRGAKATPGEKHVNLRRGTPRHVEIELEPAETLRGIVLRDGEPLNGARVTLEAPDRPRSIANYFRSSHWFLEHAMLPDFPFAFQETTTDAQGRFMLTAWDEVTPNRYLRAESSDGEAFAIQLVRPGATDLKVELKSQDLTDSSLRVRMLGRVQDLPVELIVNGTPVDPFMLPPDEDLVIEDLIAGRWRVNAEWHTDELYEELSQRIDGEAVIELTLPERALVGDDREAWKRAGKVFPLE